MSNNLENEKTVSTSKMYPIDLAHQKITMVKSIPSTEVKITHLVAQPKTTNVSQLITHPAPIGLMRPQLLSSTGTSQTHMIVSNPSILQGTQIVNQGSQIIGTSGSQMISQTQLIGPSGQIVGPTTQIISQGTQLNAQLGNPIGPNSTGAGNQVSVTSSVSPVLNVGGQFVSGTGSLVVGSSGRTLHSSVRVLPPQPLHSTHSRPVLSNTNLGGPMGQNSTNVVVTKTISSHVPRGPAAGASLAVPRVARPVTPAAQTPITSLGALGGGGLWGVSAESRGRAVQPRASPALTLHPASAALQTSGSVISSPVRAPARVPSPAAPKPVPLVQRNYQPTAKVVGVVGNSAPAQLYYEVPRADRHYPAAGSAPAPAPAPLTSQLGAVRPPPPASAPPRPSILRKRDLEASPPKQPAVVVSESGVWSGVVRGSGGGGGSTTESASCPDSDPPSPPEPPEPRDVSPRKKPRKQTLSSEVRPCEFPSAPSPRAASPPAPSPRAASPPAPAKPPQKRPLLSSSYVCGWRATALHFVRPADVRRREPKPKDILALASRKDVKAAAEGWKVHHLTAQMDDLVSLESDVGEQLSHLLKTLETSHGKAQSILAPHAHTLLELVKGNIQRSKTVCEGVAEARDDVLRVFTHRAVVADILARQADKRCFRKHSLIKKMASSNVM